MIKLKGCIRKGFNLFAYITLDLSLWMLSYYQMSKWNYEDIGEKVIKRFGGWF